MILLLPELLGYPVDDLLELLKCLERDMLECCFDLRFGDQAIRADQSEEECGDGEAGKAHLRIGQ